MEIPRPPIVTVLGHVDHGKTSLLDAIRKTNIAIREAGGITQSIGASLVTTKDGKKITFLDTPGHAAFSQMRSRGAKVADIAILVVAADDGVKPQTKEALQFIKEAQIPFIVAGTKVDLPTANVEKVRTELENEGVAFEGRGGDTILTPISSKTGQGIDELLEMITLVSELHEISSDPKGRLEAIVIETSKDRRGLLVSVVVRSGSLVLGKNIFAESVSSRVRGLFDSTGKPIREAGPGEPCQILGFDQLPPVGTRIGEHFEGSTSEKNEALQKSQIKENLGVPILIKTKTYGSLEAILANVPKGVDVLFSGVGEPTETDILLAKTGEASVFTFEAKVPKTIQILADKEGVKIESFNVIYELLQALETLLKENKEEIEGEAQIIAKFPFENKKVAGCKVTSGKFSKSDTLILMRGTKKLGKVKILSMRKQKLNILEAKQGEEFGLIFEPQLDFMEGDVILSVKT
ncbi:GTP-binding protein [Candidatus Woesebacteria bacterium]|nr:GTP-binding protein [Candidatus Woesebacteria bacterium]